MKNAPSTMWNQVEQIAKEIIVTEITRASEVLGSPYSQEQLEQLRQASVLQLRGIVGALTDTVSLRERSEVLQYEREQLAALKVNNPMKRGTLS